MPPESPAWSNEVGAITLVVDDLAAAKDFYTSVFGRPLAFEDADSAVFKFGSLMVNLLAAPAAVELVAPLAVGDASSGPRAMLSVFVDDVDAVCRELRSKGVAFVNGPIDRPWGMRTVSFTDPGGHLWEVAQELA